MDGGFEGGLIYKLTIKVGLIHDLVDGWRVCVLSN